MATPRILVTNDDGIDSVGLHVLARALVDLGEVMIVAPDEEYSGAGASIGPLHLIQPEAHTADVDGIGHVVVGDRTTGVVRDVRPVSARSGHSPI